MSFYAFLSIWSQQYPRSALFNRLFTFNKRVSEEIKIFRIFCKGMLTLLGVSHPSFDSRM